MTLPFHLPRALAHLHSRPVDRSDAQAVLALRRKILTTMPAHLRAVDPTQGCLPDVEARWADVHLGHRSHSLGVFQGEQLVAVACLVLADRREPDDPGHTLGLHPDHWHRSAHMAACLVNEDHRGLHLQSRLLNWRRDTALAHGRTLLLAMTAWGNTYSRRNLLSAGLGIAWLGETRPGSGWYGLALDLDQPESVSNAQDHEWVGLNQRERQMDLLRRGYVGSVEWPCLPTDRRREPRLQFVPRPESGWLNHPQPTRLEDNAC